MIATRRIYLVALAAALFSLVADQASKWALIDLLARHGNEPIHVLPVFDLVMWWNHDTSFNLLHIGSDKAPYVLSLAALVIVGLLVLWLSRVASPILAAALGAVIGGALGNVVDRLRFGAVADFFYAHIGDLGWPAFNVADSMIVVGVGVLVFDGLFGGRTTGGMAQGKRP